MENRGFPRFVPTRDGPLPGRGKTGLEGEPGTTRTLQDHPSATSDALEGLDGRAPFLLFDPILELRERLELLRERKERLRDVDPGERSPGGAVPRLPGLYDGSVLVVLGRRDEPDDPVVRRPKLGAPRVDLEAEVLDDRGGQGEQMTLSRARRGDESVADRFDGEGLPGRVRGDHPHDPGAPGQERDRPA